MGRAEGRAARYGVIREPVIRDLITGDRVRSRLVIGVCIRLTRGCDSPGRFVPEERLTRREH